MIEFEGTRDVHEFFHFEGNNGMPRMENGGGLDFQNKTEQEDFPDFADKGNSSLKRKKKTPQEMLKDYLRTVESLQKP